MVTPIEITNAAKKRKINACFVATGQTGIMIEGSGIAVDHVISDFISGAAEKLVLDRIQYKLFKYRGTGQHRSSGIIPASPLTCCTDQLRRVLSYAISLHERRFAIFMTFPFYPFLT